HRAVPQHPPAAVDLHLSGLFPGAGAALPPDVRTFVGGGQADVQGGGGADPVHLDRKSTRLNSSHVSISYAVFCLKKKNKKNHSTFFLFSSPALSASPELTLFPYTTLFRSYIELFRNTPLLLWIFICLVFFPVPELLSRRMFGLSSVEVKLMFKAAVALILFT